MKEKCPDIDTSSKSFKIEENTKDYQNLDISALEKEFKKTQKEFEKVNKKNKNNKKTKFKKAQILNDDSNSKIENENDTHLHRSIYEIEEPLYRSHFGIIIAILIILILIIFISFLITNHFSNNNTITNENKNIKDNSDIEKIVMKNRIYQVIRKFHNFTKEEISQINVHNLSDQLYVDLCLQGILLNRNQFNLSESPKISIIKPIYNSFNSLKYLNYSLRSIQNQDFLDIEIIIIDDASNDNNETINLVQKFQEEDPRIKLLINEKEMGLLYTICRGILNAKGKYIMELDQDDLYTYGTLFTELYYEAEYNNLDILSFWGMKEKNRYKVIKPDYENINIGKIFEDKKSRIQLSYRKKVENFFESGMVWNKLMRTETLQNTVKDIGEEYYRKYIFTHEDSILVFMMYREAKRVKEYRRFGHLKFLHDESISSEKTLKKNESQYCYEYLTYFDFIIEKSENEAIDKYYAAKDFITRYQEMKHMINMKNKDLAINITKKYLNCEYIPLHLINKINDIYKEIIEIKEKNN